LVAYLFVQNNPQSEYRQETENSLKALKSHIFYFAIKVRGIFTIQKFKVK